MTDRILDIAETGVKVSVRNRQLVIARKDEPDATVPLEEVAVIVGSNPHIVYTQAALAGLMEHGGVLVACDASHNPVGMMLPLTGHHLQTERMIRQAQVPIPTRKRLWQAIVKQKVGVQATALENLHESDFGLRALQERVRSGDPDNIEAQAARKYWPALLGPDFRRDRNGKGPNQLLNYGYGVLRATVARAVCAAGLHPSLGLNHHNRYNAFCLVDDLMEPCRPLVDRGVVTFLDFYGPDPELDSTAKRALIETLTGRVRVENEWLTLFDALTRYAVSLAQVFSGDRRTLLFPSQWWPDD